MNVKYKYLFILIQVENEKNDELNRKKIKKKNSIYHHLLFSFTILPTHLFK